MTDEVLTTHNPKFAVAMPTPKDKPAFLGGAHVPVILEQAQDTRDHQSNAGYASRNRAGRSDLLNQNQDG